MSFNNLVFQKKRLENIYGLLTIISTNMDEMVKIAATIISIPIREPDCLLFIRNCKYAQALLNDDLKGRISSPPRYLQSMNRLKEDECMFKMSEWFHELETELISLNERNCEEQALVFDEIEEIEFTKKPSKLEQFVKETFFYSIYFWITLFDRTKDVILDQKKEKGTNLCTCF